MTMTTNQPNRAALMTFALPDLYDYRVDTNAELLRAKAALTEVDGVIAERLRPLSDIAYVASGKMHGTVRFEVDGGMEAKADIAKKVEWDQQRLREIASGMDWPTIQHFFKIEFTVPEKIFDALPPDDPRKRALTAARTVKYGEPKIVLEKKE